MPATQGEGGEMELPECPVCLQVFNNDDAVPRVLSCGHSACEACLRQLPQRFPNTVRCPACTQLVKYPEAQGPSALPKNIDLLSFINQQNPDPNSSQSRKQPKTHLNHSTTHVSQHRDFLPRLLWSEEFYSDWKDWILSSDAVSVEERGEDLYCSVFQGRITSSSSSSSLRDCCFPEENRMVSLVRIASSYLTDSAFSYSYTTRIMEALNRLQETEISELGFILRASLRQSRMCKAYGLWMDSEDRSVFLVCEKFSGDFSERLSGLIKESTCKDWDGLPEGEMQNLGMNIEISGFAMVGMELCEAVMALHSEGLVCGCLALSCFSFDHFGRVFVDPNGILVMGRRIQKYIAEAASGTNSDDFEKAAVFTNILKTQACISPELLFELLNNQGIATDCGSLGYSVGYGSDVWSLACILVRLLVGDSFTEEPFKGKNCFFTKGSEENCADHLGLYRGWIEKVGSLLEVFLGTKFASLQQILCRCLNFDPASRPHVTEVWRCIRELLIKPHIDILVSLEAAFVKENMVYCLILGDLCHPHKETEEEPEKENRDGLLRSNGSSEVAADQVGEGKVDGDLVDDLSVSSLKSIILRVHLDCITKFSVGGGFLFSSSYDKTVNVWNLQDFSHVQSLRGHEHRVTALVFVDANEPLCISSDIGGGIFVWGIGIPFEQKPIKSWYEPKDWRYSGIHALAISGTEHLYTGSGDKSIKAWSLRDYTLTCTMSGHKSAVSSLAVCDGVLYSGSWDGTIHLWCLDDHSPLTVLGDDMLGNTTPVLSISVDHHMLVASHENGCVKMWRNDVIVGSTQTHNGAIFALAMDGKRLFMGGWNKTIDVQEFAGDELQIDIRTVGSIACDSVITALLFWQGKLFVGFADGFIKVYHH